MNIEMKNRGGIKLLVGGKICEDDIAVVPKLADGSATPSKDAQTVPIPEGFAGFRTFKVEAIPSTYVPEGYVPEGTVPEGYVKPEGEVVVTENVTGMDITDKKTLTVAVEGGAEMNVAFGDTEPDDTSKLWIKTAETENVQVKANVEHLLRGKMESDVAQLPKPAESMGSAVVGDNVYLFGGRAAMHEYLDGIYIFDSKNKDGRYSKSSLGDMLCGMSAEAVGNNVYLFGGNTDYSEYNGCQKYNTETEELTTIQVTPYQFSYMASSVVGNKIYLFGGKNSNTGINSKAIYIFDAETETAQLLDNVFQNEIMYATAEAVGDKIYIFGGKSSYVVYNTIYEFDTKTNKLTTLDVTLPRKMNSMCSAVFGKNIFLFGGWDDTSADTSNRILVFNTENKSIKFDKSYVPVFAMCMSAESIGDTIYLFGGGDSRYFDSIHAFNLSVDIPASHVLIESGVSDNTFNILPNVEIGVKNVYLGNADGLGERVDAYINKNGFWTNVFTGERLPITFTVDGTAYQAAKGMKWYEWINDAEYPIGDIYINADSGVGYMCVRNIGPIYHNGTKVVAGDAIISGAAYTTDNTITFTIDSISYKADKGMTWSEWIVSGHNTGSRYMSMEGEVFDTQAGCYVCLPNGNHVSDAAEITDGAEYILPV